jgi:hypothetical protein
VCKKGRREDKTKTKTKNRKEKEGKSTETKMPSATSVTPTLTLTLTLSLTHTHSLYSQKFLGFLSETSNRQLPLPRNPHLQGRLSREGWRSSKDRWIEVGRRSSREKSFGCGSDHLVVSMCLLNENTSTP